MGKITAKIFKCKGKGCNGVVNPNNAKPVSLRTGCQFCDDVYPCDTCGKLHNFNGKPIEHRFDGAEVFWINGEIIHKKDGKEVKYDF